VQVIPVRLAYINGPIRSGRFLNNLEQFDIQFEVFDNDTGIFSESTSGWNTYDSKILLDDPNIVSGSVMSQEFQQQISTIDNTTGKFIQSSSWTRHKPIKTKGFRARGRAEIKKLKQLLLALRGRQKSFYLPTFIDDMTVVANLSTGGNTLDIDHIGLARFVGTKGQPKNTIRLTFTDGSSLVREIVSAAEVSSTVERLTLDSNWPADRTIGEIERVEFLELHRFDTDQFLLRFSRVGSVNLTAPVKSVFS
jgi:hypothetical protein